jgi:hypothetical protein
MSKNSRRSIDTPRSVLTLGQSRSVNAAGNVRARTDKGSDDEGRALARNRRRCVVGAWQLAPVYAAGSVTAFGAHAVAANLGRYALARHGSRREHAARCTRSGRSPGIASTAWRRLSSSDE